MPSPPRAICFDLGGVVIRICRTWREGCAAAGVPCTVDPGVGAEPTLIFEDLHRQHQVGAIDGATYAERLAERLDNAYAPAQILAVHDAWLLGSYAEVADIVRTLDAQGVVTAALSNTNAEHWVRMGEFPAVGCMTHRFASHEIGLVKPEPAIYQWVRRHLEVPADDILLLDDLERNVEAARDAGWRAECIDPDGETAPRIRAALARHGLAL